MEVLSIDSEAEPIVFDKTNLSPPLAQPDELAYRFHFGRLTFGNEIYDTVAINRGIDDEGRLDMSMVAAAESVDEYLKGKQGQPVVMSEFTYYQDRLVRVCSLVGVLSDEQSLVGRLFDVGAKSGGRAGIKLKGDCYTVEADVVDRIRLTRLDRVAFDFMPITSRDITLGKPGGGHQIDDYRSEQYVTAGEDILKLLEAKLTAPISRYELWLGLIDGLKDPAARQYMLQSPYSEMLSSELNALHSAVSTLTAAKNKTNLYEAAIRGTRAEASLELAAIELSLGELACRLPYTTARVTSEVTALTDYDSRLKAVTKVIDRLSGYKAT